MSRLSFLSFSVFLFFSAGTGAAFAQGASPESIVLQVFNFGLTIGGFLAFAVIVYAGFRYVVAAGNPSVQGDAKDRIWQAIIGIFLLLFSGIMLRIINPVFEGPVGISALAPLPAVPPPEVCTVQCSPDSLCVVVGGAPTCMRCTLDCKDQACIIEPTGAMRCEGCPSITQDECTKQGKICILGPNYAFTCAATECGKDFGSCCPGQLSCDKVCNFYPGIGGAGAYRCDDVKDAALPPPIVTNPFIPRPTPGPAQASTTWWCQGQTMRCVESDEPGAYPGLCTVTGNDVPADITHCGG